MSSIASPRSWTPRAIPAWALAGVAAALYLVLAPPSADLAAQYYRADLGLVLWDNGWYGGHHMPGYSLLFPPLAASMALIAAGTALPLAQPRNVVGGHVVSALVGFAAVALLGSGGWAAALAGACALGAMLVLRMSHSPAVGTAVIVGATAPAALPFLELLVLASLILVVFGIVGARLEGKTYPVYWW